jgi:SAM-dependent methyltransferase
MKKSFSEKIRKGLKHPELVLLWLLNKSKKPFRPFIGRKFDMNYNVSTEEHVGLSLLNPININNLKHAIEYQPTPIGYLETLYKNLSLRSEEMTFVDLGCGKGRACFYATRRYKKIIGIDFSPLIIDQAKKNLMTFRNTSEAEIDFQVGDARTYRLPNEQSLVYLCNPFDEYILKDFLDNNIDHFKIYNSRIAYLVDPHRYLLEEYGFQQDYRHSILGISVYSFVPSKLQD